MGRKYYLDPETGEKIYIKSKIPSLNQYRKSADQDAIDSSKVDKVSGKGLSTNDYDNTAKSKVDAIPNNPKYTDTVYNDTSITNRVSAIEDNMIDSVSVNGVEQTVDSDGNVNIQLSAGNKSIEYDSAKNALKIGATVIEDRQLEIDDTLKMNNYAADAKAVGDELDDIKQDISALQSDKVETFLAIYNQTTLNEVEQAINDGKILFATKNGNFLYRYIGGNYEWYVFTAAIARVSNYVSSISISKRTGQWAAYDASFQDAANRATSIIGYEASTTKYPSIKAMVDYVNRDLTLSEQNSELTRLGLNKKWEKLNEITIESDSTTFEISSDEAGNPLNLLAMRVVFYTLPNDTAEYLLAYFKLTSSDGKTAWYNASTQRPINTIAQISTYEATITNGLYNNRAWYQPSSGSTTSSVTIYSEMQPPIDCESIVGFKFMKYSNSTIGVRAGETIAIYGIRA